jgi:hypothetical protein
VRCFTFDLAWGDTGEAAHIRASHKLIVCYEMAEEFVQLYREQTAEPKPAPLSANEPIAHNITTQAALKTAPTESLATTPAPDGFERLAAAMQSIEFFAPRAALAGPAPAIHQAHK